MAGLLLLIGFYQTGSHRRLGWGWALLGLAMWDKALAIWMLGGFGVASAAVLNKKIVGVTDPAAGGDFRESASAWARCR